jgi:DNA-directed RNA polymerase subunit M/transcription elongation factor TFIIS
MEVERRMRWRKAFMAEVAEALQQLGLRACPVCGSADSLSMGRFPMLLVDAGFPPDDDEFPSPEDNRHGDMTFAVRVECSTCGHLMLFNSERYRCGDEKIMVRGLAEQEAQVGDDRPLR